MSNSLKDSIRLHMEQLTNDQLHDIWVKNNRDEYSDEAFEVISEILQERRESGESLPPQIEQIDVDEYKESFIVVLLRVIAGVTIIFGVILFFANIIECNNDINFILGIVALIGSIVAAVFQLEFAEIISLLNKINYKINN